MCLYIVYCGTYYLFLKLVILVNRYNNISNVNINGLQLLPGSLSLHGHHSYLHYNDKNMWKIFGELCIKDVGYSKDELTFVEEPPKILELECPICLQVMLNDPHLVSCCGHHFCGPCIKKANREKKPCPLCKQRHHQAMVDKNIQRNINGLHVYCINNKKGCKWKGELKDLSSHLQRGERKGECQYVSVQCKYREYRDTFALSKVYQGHSFKPCEFIDQRYKVDAHETNDCPNRPYKCEYCGYDDSYVNITEIHYSSCYYYPMSCPNNCTQDKIPRCLLKGHLDISCPLQPVECEFSWAGCKVKSKRQDLPKHCSENLQQHFSQVAEACKELKKENAQLKKDVAELKERVKYVK